MEGMSNMNKKVENSIYIIIGAILIVIVELKLIHLAEILALTLGFIGFAALLKGAFGLYNLHRPSPDP